ncbi:MAG: hypothetical protein FWD71_03935 [Oscillospiraceae bacterium]|nr:hypothetical protein [Oscillospiraceae bacterium]
MKTLKISIRLIGKICLIIGIVFLALSIFSLILRLASVNLVFSTLAVIFCTNGIPWIILGICFYLYSRFEKSEQLKKDGVRYDAEIVRILPGYNMRVGFGKYNSANAAYVECFYRNQESKTCLVKSDLIMLDYAVNYFGDNGKELLNAAVYVSPKDPRDYFVEISPKAEVTSQFDYDYRNKVEK